MSATEFYLMSNSAYPQVPYAQKRKSNYVDLPNSYYDSIEGQRVIEYQVKLLVEAEEYGFEGGVLGEQHNSPIGLMGNPMVGAAWVAARTSTLKIAVIGPLLAAYQTPIRLAEEIALLDTLSRGRLIVGIPLGHGMSHHGLGVVNPATLRSRFKESQELLIRALSEDGPFEWFGEHFQVPYVNIWPRPLQRPHPPIVAVGGSSPETLELVATRRFDYQTVGLNSRQRIVETYDRLRQLCKGEGYELDPSQLWYGLSIHVAESDEQAHREAEGHMLWNRQNFFHSAFHDAFPPGYISSRALRGVLAGGPGGYRSSSPATETYQSMLESGNTVVGSPDTVARQISEILDEVGAGKILINNHSESKPPWLANKSLSLFAAEVLPQLRERGTPQSQHQKLAGYESLSEYGARRDRRAPNPMVNFGDGLVDLTTAHIPELRQVVEPWPEQSVKPDQ